MAMLPINVGYLMNISTAFSAVLSVITTSAGVVEKAVQTADNVISVALASSQGYKDKSMHTQRIEKMKLDAEIAAFEAQLALPAPKD
jgi:hypothetical protein